MPRPTRQLSFLVALVLIACSTSRADTPTRALQELKRFEAAEARQAIAVDASHFYTMVRSTRQVVVSRLLNPSD